MIDDLTESPPHLAGAPVTMSLNGGSFSYLNQTLWCFINPFLQCKQGVPGAVKAITGEKRQVLE